MKKLLCLLVCVLALGLIGCKEEEDVTPIDKGELDLELDASWNGFLENKVVYLTTIGQADIDIVANILAASGVKETDYTRVELLTAAEVQAGEVVLIVTGTSAKGLGAAGINQSHEQSRAENFSNKDGITVITLHVGGAGRRGSSTDPILNVLCPKSDLLLIVNSGNSDGIFTNIAKNNNVDLILFSKSTNMTNAFKQLFGK